MEDRGSLPTLMLAGVAVLIIGVSAAGMFYGHHEAIDNLMENASGDNNMLLSLDNWAVKFTPFIILGAIVLFAFLLIKGLWGGF